MSNQIIYGWIRRDINYNFKSHGVCASVSLSINLNPCCSVYTEYDANDLYRSELVIALILMLAQCGSALDRMLMILLLKSQCSSSLAELMIAPFFHSHQLPNTNDSHTSHVPHQVATIFKYICGSMFLCIWKSTNRTKRNEWIARIRIALQKRRAWSLSREKEIEWESYDMRI